MIEQRTGLILKLVKPFSDNFEVLYVNNKPGFYHVVVGGEIRERLFTKDEVADEIHFCFNVGYELLHGPLNMFI